jgi:O-antigen ligase
MHQGSLGDLSVMYVDQVSRVRLKTLLSLAALVVVVFYASGVYGYIQISDRSLKPFYWYLATAGIAVVIMTTYADRIMRNLPLPFALWIAAYFCQLLVTFLYSTQSTESTDQLIAGFQAVTLLYSFLIILVAVPERQIVPIALAAVVCLSVCINVFDFVRPTFTSVAGRAAGFYENPNTSGKIIALCMVLSCAAIPRQLRVPFCLFAGLGILLTFSRSSWLLWAIGMIGLAATHELSKTSRAVTFWIVSALSAFIIFALLSGSMLEIFYTLGLGAYLDSNTVARLGGGGTTFQDASTSVRVDMIVRSIEDFQRHPWFGLGLGSTSEWMSMSRPHNLYLMIAVEAGVLGLLVITALFIFMWPKCTSIGRVALIVYAISGFFSHMNLVQPAMLCLLAIIAACHGNRALLTRSAP